MVLSALRAHRRPPSAQAKPWHAQTSSESLRIAAIDVGSNSIHMVVAQAEPSGGLITLSRMKEAVGLGRASFPSRQISRPAMVRALATLARFKQAAVQRQAERIVCVATSAIREATNGGDFLERAKRDLGLDVRIISGREEARLIYLGVRHVIKLQKPSLIIDIGGGSVEIIVADDEQAHLLESRKLGAARMTAMFVHADPISPADREALVRHYDKELTSVCEQALKLEPHRAIGTSGTLENLAAMLHPEHHGNGDAKPLAIERAELAELTEKLIKSDTEHRSRIPGLDESRRDQITAGAILVGEIFRRLKLRKIEICKCALREGILVDYLSRHLPDLAIRQQIPDPRRRSVIALGRRCAWHKTHSEQVAKLCLQFFDQLRALHGLGTSERELIEYAALLHDIGWHISQESHHKHSMYLIQNGDLKNFSDEEIEIIANIARYHRKAMPKRKHAAYASLSPHARRVVEVGASLLRLSDGLDRSHASVVKEIRCRLGNRKIKCLVATRFDAQLELWGASRKRDFFEAVFKRPIEFELTRSS